MAYLMDNKKSLGVFVIPEASAPVVSAFKDTQIKATFMIGQDDTKKYTFPTTKAPGADYILKDVLGDGQLSWVLDTGGGGGSECKYDFVRITAPNTNYNLTAADCAIDIINDSYTTITLPSAAGLGGKVFVISRGSNTKFVLVPQPGETIDEHLNYIFLRKYVRLTVMSNDIDMWYIL